MELAEEMVAVLRGGAEALRGGDRRLFMARAVDAMGRGGAWRAQLRLGWNRGTIRKGLRELRSGVRCIDAYHLRGRKRAEEKLPNLLGDIRAIVDGQSSVDPTFRTGRLYTRVTAEEVRRQLIVQKGYKNRQLPTARTIRTKLNDLGFRLRRVAKSKPKKRFRRRMPSSSGCTP
jgi:hypothetical protein